MERGLFVSGAASILVTLGIWPLVAGTLLTGVPTLVFGYFALVVVTPLLPRAIPGLVGFDALGPGLEPWIQVQSVSKLLERMADHATNLAEEVIFMVRGEDLRHQGKLPT